MPLDFLGADDGYSVLKIEITTNFLSYEQAPRE